MSNGQTLLDKVVHDIVFNQDIHDLMCNPFREILQFQDNECHDMEESNPSNHHKTSILQEGYQVGEPFSGDIEHAPILFLSSNPAFNFNEVSPRYHSDTGEIFMPKHKDVATGKKVPAKVMTFDQIKDFFKDRIVKSPSISDNDERLRIPLKNGSTAVVPYWTCVKNNTEALLPGPLTSKWRSSLSRSQYVRKVIKYAVCMEIVPFRSSSEIGVSSQLLNVCWSNFTQHLLSLSAAEVIVLVGVDVLRTFTSQMKMTPVDIKNLKTRSRVQVNIGGKVRQVVKVDFNSGKFSNFNTFFSVSVMNQLKLSVAASPLITSNSSVAQSK